MEKSKGMDFQEIYYDFNLDELEREVREFGFQTKYTLDELMKIIIDDNSEGVLNSILEITKESITHQWDHVKGIFITLVIIVMISALFTTFKDVFQNHQIADLSFYVNYFILMVIVINIFGQALEIGENALRDTEEFMRIFFPTYFSILGTAAGVASGIAYYQIAAVIIYLVEWGMVSVLLPALSIYMLFVLMNGVWEDGKLSLLLKFIQQGIQLAMKFTLRLLTGASILQSFIRPLIDRLKGEMVYKAVEAVPGIGEVAEGTLRIWLGSAILIKNTVGLAGCIFLGLLCLSPILKIFLLGGMLKITSAILSVVGEKKMIICINQVGDAILMILQTVSYGLLFFVVLIAITAYATNGGI